MRFVPRGVWLSFVLAGCAAGETVNGLPSSEGVSASGADSGAAGDDSGLPASSSGSYATSSGSGGTGSSGGELEAGDDSSSSSGSEGGGCTTSCSGCCDSNGNCQAGTDDTVCGSGAESCFDCTTNAQTCQSGGCSGGGSGSSGGGSGSGSSSGSNCLLGILCRPGGSSGGSSGTGSSSSSGSSSGSSSSSSSSGGSTTYACVTSLSPAPVCASNHDYCLCTENSQCNSNGMNVVNNGGCNSGHCTGTCTGGQFTDSAGCSVVAPTCNLGGNQGCPADTTCEVNHGQCGGAVQCCWCTKDSACAVSGKCINDSAQNQCNGSGPCTGTGTDWDGMHCQLASPGIPMCSAQ
jgi:hypothetical protein